MKINWNKTDSQIARKLQLCVIRKDLLDQDLSMPIWKGKENKNTKYVYISGSKPRVYRWLKDTSGFQIKHKGQWYNAYSIDFDF